MIIKSMTVDYGTLEMTVKFSSQEDMRVVADSILNNRLVTVSKEIQDAQIKSLLYAGQKIEAIRYHRAVNGTSLKDAKDYVDKIQELL